MSDDLNWLPLGEAQKLASLFDPSGAVDQAALLRRTIADMAVASDKLKEQLNQPDNGGDRSAQVARWGKLLKDLSAVLLALKKTDEEAFSLKSPSVRLLVNYMIEKMDQSFAKINAESGLIRLFYQHFELLTQNWQEDVQRLIDEAAVAAQEDVTAHDRGNSPQV